VPLLVETARYWASRARRDADGRVHIDAVIGPDEYHESVNDNAYTNVMARWNLRAGADAADRAGIAADTRRWRELADGLVDGYDAATGRYEQFAGYFGLEPLLVAEFAEPPVAADLLVGRDRLSGSQIIKQPDVLMLHHLVPSQVQPGSLEPNLDFYGPRTAHGSSLSPAVTATLLARAGRADEALAMLGLALMLDIGDTTGMTAAGLHMANLAGVWQAMLGGFAGVAVHTGVLTIDPQLPAAWGSLEIRFRCLGRRVRLSITRDDVVVRADGPLQARLVGDGPRAVSGTTRLGRPRLRAGEAKGGRS
jgi:trehalose/maltose hydrolase-like predicted phosphorylase